MLENQRLDPNQVGVAGINAVWLCAYANQYHIMQDINHASQDWQNPVDLNSKNKEGINALHLTAYYHSDV